MRTSTGIGTSISMLGNRTLEWWAAYRADGLLPKLIANFADNKYYSGGVDKNLREALSVSRTGAKPAWLANGDLGWAGMNLLSYSEDYSNVVWSQTNGSYSGGVFTDDGLGGSGSVGLQRFSVVTPIDTQVTYRARVKQDQLTWVALETAGFDAAANGKTFFDLSLGVVGITDPGHTAEISNAGGGYYWVSIGFSSTVDLSGSVTTRGANSDGDAIVDRDGTSSFYVEKVHVYRSDGNMQPNPDLLTTPTYYPTTDSAYFAPAIAYNPARNDPLAWKGHNEFKYSEQLDNGVWSRGGGITVAANAHTDPKGGNTADEITYPTGGSTDFFRYGGLVLSAGVSRTTGVWVKSISGNTDFTIDYENLYFSTTTTLTSEWQFIEFIYTPAVERTWVDFQIGGTGVIAMWGAHLYRSDYPMEDNVDGTSYYPTTATTIPTKFTDDSVQNTKRRVMEGNALTRLNTHPRCNVGDGWVDGGSTSTNLSLSRLGVFNGVSVASNGLTWHRLRESNTYSLTATSIYPFEFEYDGSETTEDTASGSVYITIDDDTNAIATSLAGVVGSVAVTSSLAGTVSGLTEVLLSDGVTHRLTGYFTPLNTAVFRTGIGSFSATAAETIVALGTFFGDAGEKLSHAPTIGGDGSSTTVVKDELQLGRTANTDLVTNGTFSSDTDWIKGAGWTIGAGVATHALGATTSLIEDVPSLVVGRTYRMTFTVSGRTAGAVRTNAGFSGVGSYQTTNGTFVEDVVCAGDSSVAIEGQSTFDGSVDNVIVQELTPFVGFNLAQGTFVFKGQWKNTGTSSYMLGGDLGSTRFIWHAEWSPTAVRSFDGTTDLGTAAAVFTEDTKVAAVQSYLAGGNFNILVDGSAEGSAALTGDLYTSKINVGHNNGIEGMHGILDEIIYYNVQLVLATRQGFSNP